MNKELIKCYEFYFDDIDASEQDIDQLIEWIKSDVLGLKEGEYKIGVKYLTKKTILTNKNE